MAAYRVQQAAGRRIDDIYRYTRDRWDQDQAENYIRGLFARFEDIAMRDCVWRDIPAEFGVDGFFAAMNTIIFIGASCRTVLSAS